MTIGDRVRKLRALRGWTQGQLLVQARRHTPPALLKDDAAVLARLNEVREALADEDVATVRHALRSVIERVVWDGEAIDLYYRAPE